MPLGRIIRHSKVFHELTPLGLQSNNEFVPFILLFTEAYFYLRKGKEVPALRAIRKGMKKGREKGSMNLLMPLEPCVSGNCPHESTEHGIEEKYIKTPIRKKQDHLLQILLAVDERWPWPLETLNTLGRFGLGKQGSP